MWRDALEIWICGGPPTSRRLLSVVGCQGEAVEEALSGEEEVETHLAVYVCVASRRNAGMFTPVEY